MATLSTGIIVPSHFSIPQQNNTAAAQVNAGLSLVNLKSMALFNLDTRLKNELSNDTSSAVQLNKVVDQLKISLINDFPTFDDFIDKVCDGTSIKMSDIRIDAIMQRKLLLKWIIEILMNVKPTRIMALNVYKEKDDTGVRRYSCWDGQHTAIVLYIIVTQVYGLTNLDKIKIPTVIFKGTTADNRKNFTVLNSSEGKNLVDEFELFQGRVISARLDGSTDILDVLSEQVQELCEKHDVFITHPKFKDDHNPGAISRLLEVKKYIWQKAPRARLDVLENTMKLHNKLFKNEPFEKRELDTLCMFFDICHSNGIKIDDDYIQEMTNVLDGRFGDWDSDFVGQVNNAYIDWWHQSTKKHIHNHARFNASHDQFCDYLIRLLEISSLFDGTKYRLPGIRNTHYLASSF